VSDDGQADSARARRHAARTCIGQISGYCDLLLEEAGEKGYADIVPDLLAIQTAGTRLLELLGDAPLAATPDTPGTRARRAGRGKRKASAAGGGHVLVVDDDASNRDLLRRRLERLGCRVSVAEHGRQALEMLRADDPDVDLVLLDILMPEMDGYETLSRLKSDPGLREIPVIVLSALGDLASAVRCIELGAEDYLPKPIERALLRARVETCLEKKRLRDQESAYLRDVARVTAAAGDIEAGVFDPDTLADLATRSDALGRLVRVVQGVAAAYTRQALLAQENARLLEVLREQVDELERSRRLIATAEERLRQDIAERLHSRVQNRLLLAWYRLEDCREMLPEQPAQLRDLVAQVSQQLQEIREHDIREVSHLLHPSIIRVGLAPALERLAEDFLPQFRVELDVDQAVGDLDDPESNRLPEPVRLAAYRVVEEAFGNAARHARASQVGVGLSVRDGQLAVQVRDDGQGFDSGVVQPGLGLSSIAARVGSVGGTWRVTSAVGRGTLLEAFLPFGPVPAYERVGRAVPVDAKRLS
jgi:signal transduction histidine kinase